MSGNEKRIICRHCRETISVEAGNCPHCGTSIRGNLGPAAGILVGLLLVAAAALNLSELLVFGLVGLALVAVGGYILYDKRQRINEATSEAQAVSGIGDRLE
jgi:hypothetical protein